MMTLRELGTFNPQLPAPGDKLPVGPTDLRDPGGRDFVAAWQAHVDAGRIGTRLDTPEAIRAVVLANERLLCGDGTLLIW
ncbi:MAG: hypothetical protein GW858_13545 [Sphingomonadales bacterium]|nr:hypothetical protein [Sphingomonadales bacterium]NCQ22270.1 hypothetical protein [Sphingomonadales bacterium]NCT04695.1 hypothetical protein [Sphingomonadales bacterium]